MDNKFLLIKDGKLKSISIDDLAKSEPQRESEMKTKSRVEQLQKRFAE